jgi:hypothetical protein
VALFQKKAAPEPEPPQGGGLDVLRARVRAHVRYPQSHGIFARELRLSGSDVDSFVAGAGPRSNLTLEQIGGALAFLGMQAAYDPGRDLLVSLSPPAKRLGVGPPSAPVRTLEEILGPGAERCGSGWMSPRAPRPVKDEPPSPPKPARAPGWA